MADCSLVPTSQVLQLRRRGSCSATRMLRTAARPYLRRYRYPFLLQPPQLLACLRPAFPLAPKHPLHCLAVACLVDPTPPVVPADCPPPACTPANIHVRTCSISQRAFICVLFICARDRNVGKFQRHIHTSSRLCTCGTAS